MATIYCIGICGTGMGALAGLLKSQGHRVRGSDAAVYPPMSDKLRDWGIEILEGYDSAHLEPPPDLVICGNVVRADNPEAQKARALQLPTLSMPQAVAQYGIGNKHSIVIAGTHGKTTTSALTAHLLRDAGIDPSYLVGGALIDVPESFHHGRGDYFVVEGDEYDTAYFDKGPKFLHYRARTAVITSLEFDHADIFSSVEAVEEAFAKLIDAVPATGHLIVWHGAERVRKLLDAHGSGCRVSLYATTPQADAQAYMRTYASTPAGLQFEPVIGDTSLGPMQVGLWGDMAAANVLAALLAAREAGLDAAALRRGCRSFAGVKRRLEVRGEVDGVCIVDDFAHHPTAVRLTLQAARTRWPTARLWALFEPRSATSRRNYFQAAYVEAFAGADCVVIGSHARLQEVPAAQRFSPEQLAADLQHRGVAATALAEPVDIAAHLKAQARLGDVVLVLSNGDFGGLHNLLLRSSYAG
jgi:UDP-N-acetylmuramate: L-alanyl-gamma-D-glutamyl-meso-diaminopimelate ligase